MVHAFVLKGAGLGDPQPKGGDGPFRTRLGWGLGFFGATYGRHGELQGTGAVAVD